jgi:hypothetical protein
MGVSRSMLTNFSISNCVAGIRPTSCAKSDRLLEYAFGTAPTLTESRSLPEGGVVPDGAGGEYFEIRFTQPPGITGITYGAEWSPSLTGASWTPVPDTGVAPEHVFRVSIVDGSRGFMRVVVRRTP